MKVGCCDNSFIREPFFPQKVKELKLREKIRKKNEEIKDIQCFTVVKCKINFRVIAGAAEFCFGQSKRKIVCNYVRVLFFSFLFAGFQGQLQFTMKIKPQAMCQNILYVKIRKSLENPQRMFHHPFHWFFPISLSLTCQKSEIY